MLRDGFLYFRDDDNWGCSVIKGMLCLLLGWQFLQVGFEGRFDHQLQTDVQVEKLAPDILWRHRSVSMANSIHKMQCVYKGGLILMVNHSK